MDYKLLLANLQFTNNGYRLQYTIGLSLTLTRLNDVDFI